MCSPKIEVWCSRKLKTLSIKNLAYCYFRYCHIRSSGSLRGDLNSSLLCPRCLKFLGKNSRSLKTHMRYCNKGDVMRYIELSTASKDCCECGFTSPVPKGLQSHQLTCELIKRRLNQSHIGQIAPNSKIRMWITTQWYTGTVIEHTPTPELPHLYRIRFRAKGEMPKKYDLEQFNFRLIPRNRKTATSSSSSSANGTGATRTRTASPPRRRSVSGKKRKFERIQRDENDEDESTANTKRQELRSRKRKKKKRRKVEDPQFVYLHDITRYRHQLFNKQYDAFQSYVDDWLSETRRFMKQFD